MAIWIAVGILYIVQMLEYAMLCFMLKQIRLLAEWTGLQLKPTPKRDEGAS